MAALAAANPQITDWGRVLIGQAINIPPGGALPSATPEPTTPPTRTYPPLPAVGVTATGKFTAEEGLVALTTGTSIVLKFRFDGGRVTGSGVRPRWQAPGSVVGGRKCIELIDDALTLVGTFDAPTRHLTGTAQVTETITVARPECKGDAAVVKTALTWQAQVAANGKSLSGTMVGQGSIDQPFIATIKTD